MGTNLVNIEKGQNLPEHLRNATGHEGLENVRQSDLILPRLSICQSMTPQRKKSNTNYIDKLEEGQFFNTVTEQIYGSKVEFIPLVYSKSRIYFRDLDEGGGILCQSSNGVDGGTIAPTCAKCPNSQFSGSGTERQSPVCTEFLNFPVMLLEDKNITVASFKSTALKEARRWLTRMALGNKPIFAGVHELVTKEEKGTKGSYFSPVIKFKRWTTADEFKMAEAHYHELKDRTIKTDEDVPEQDNEEDIPY